MSFGIRNANFIFHVAHGSQTKSILNTVENLTLRKLVLLTTKIFTVEFGIILAYHKKLIRHAFGTIWV